MSFNILIICCSSCNISWFVVAFALAIALSSFRPDRRARRLRVAFQLWQSGLFGTDWVILLSASSYCFGEGRRVRFSVQTC